MQRFSKMGIAQRSLIFYHSSKEYPASKALLEKKKKLRNKLENSVIPVNNSLLRYIKRNGNKVSLIKNETDGLSNDIFGYKSNTSRSTLNIVDQNLMGIDFRMVNSNVIKYNNTMSGNKQKISPNIHPITTSTNTLDDIIK